MAPFVGLSQSARACANGQIYVAENTKMSWFHLENQNGARISLLDVIAALGIRDFREPIPDHKRQEVKAALEKLAFHVIFTPELSNKQQDGESYDSLLRS